MATSMSDRHPQYCKAPLWAKGGNFSPRPRHWNPIVQGRDLCCIDRAALAIKAHRRACIIADTHIIHSRYREAAQWQHAAAVYIRVGRKALP